MNYIDYFVHTTTIKVRKWTDISFEDIINQKNILMVDQSDIYDEQENEEAKRELIERRDELEKMT